MRNLLNGLNPCKMLIPMAVLLISSFNLQADIMATGTFTDTQPLPGTYEYNITLNNTGTTTIGTFWFAWIPGANFMSAMPTNVQSPTGWSYSLTGSLPNGIGIRWVSTTDLLASGASMPGFMFDSTLAPADLEAPYAGMGTGAGDTVATSFAYIGAAFADPGTQFVVTQGPEPSTALLIAFGIGMVGFGRLARRRSARP